MKPISFKEARKQGIKAEANIKSGSLYRRVVGSGIVSPDLFRIDYEIEGVPHVLEVSPGRDSIGQSEEIRITHGEGSVVIPREFAAAVAKAMSKLGGRTMENSKFKVRKKD
ncbi:hypothetical protein ACTXJG_08350 [Glutamicibacter arilaitensis]|uniref:hypothetical protein n=1 Tax=Glutamicibacter arilaitensis TaxID=256701 RepID=UPI003FD684CD